MTTPATPEQQAALLAAVEMARDNLLTPLAIASFLSCALLGIVASLDKSVSSIGELSGPHHLCSTGVSYFSRFPNDRPVYKALVAFLVFGCIVDTGITASWMYQWAVSFFGRPQQFAIWPWQFTAYAGITGPMVFIAQAFFTWRLWIVSGRKAPFLVGLTLLIALGALGTCCYMFVFALRADMLAEFTEMAPACWGWLGSQLAVDVLITSGMLWWLVLRPKKMGGAETVYSSALMRIVVKTVETNTASLVLQTLVIILIGFSLNKNSLHYTIAGFLESKMYALCVIATLNARSTTHPHDTTPSHSSNPGTRSKGFGARLFNGGGRSAANANSVHVHVVEERAVDEPKYGSEVALTPAPLGKYSVQFDMEDGRSESEKGARY
ncbi:hypothetical protein JCM6882_004322 [Rhodosporidiobolus microsporus]